MSVKLSYKLWGSGPSKVTELEEELQGDGKFSYRLWGRWDEVDTVHAGQRGQHLQESSVGPQCGP